MEGHMYLAAEVECVEINLLIIFFHLGICIGIFLGFLLWKRRLGSIPYYLSQ